MFILKQDKFVSQSVLPLWPGSSCHSSNSQSMLTCVVIQLLELLIAPNPVTVHFIYKFFTIHLDILHVGSISAATKTAVSYVSCWCAVFN